MSTKPNLFIVGAPKCATSSFYEYLGEHPEVFMTRIKQPHHFCKDLWHPHTDHYGQFRTLDGYLKLFEDAQGQPIQGEASVWYLFSRIAAEEIHRFNPDAKILIHVRNPVDYLYSLHGELMVSGDEQITDFDDAVEAPFATRERLGMPATNRFRYGVTYLSSAMFSQQIARFQAHFPPEQIKINLMDDVKADLPSVYADVCRFLDIDDAFQPDFTPRNTARRVRSRALMQLAWSQSPLKKAITRRLPHTWREGGAEVLYKLNTQVRRREPMSDATRRHLRQRVDQEIQRLSALLDRDLSHWQ